MYYLDAKRIADQQRQRAEQERQRAEQAEQRAEQAEQRAEQAEQRAERARTPFRRVEKERFLTEETRLTLCRLSGLGLLSVTNFSA